MKALFRPILVLLAATVLLALGGCAGPRVIDSQVQSFTAATPAQRPASYRFERLPSQADSALQSRVEAMAAVALAGVDLTPAPLVSGAIAGTAAAAPSARYAVQVSVEIGVLPPPGGLAVGGFWERHDRWGGLGMVMEPAWYRHTVRLLLRDSHSGQPAYETSATFDGPWSDSEHLLPVLLQAALQDYPNPPSGPHTVVIELPGSAPGAR